MRQKSVPEKEPATQVVKNIRRATRRHFSAEDKIRIVLEGLRGEDSIAELCRREGIVQNLYYRWSKDFLEAGKKRLLSDFFTRRLLSDLCSASQVERASNCDERWGSCVNLAQRARDYTGLFIRQSEDAEAYRAWLEHDLRQAMLDGHGGKTQGLMMLVH